MDTGSGHRRPHAVCVPFPAQGHINPMLQLAKLLHSRGFYITFVNTEFNHRRLMKSKGVDLLDRVVDDFRFRTITDGLPPSDRDAMQDVPALCDSTRKNMLGPFRELLGEISTSKEVPPVSCIVSDGVMSFAMEAAEEIGVPEVQFWTASACGFMAYLQFPELVNRGIFPFKGENYLTDGTLDTTIDWIPGMRNIRLRDIPSFIRTTDVNDTMFDFMGTEAQSSLRSSGIIFNTFDELENEVLEKIAEISPPIYSIGPLRLLLGQGIKEDHLKSFRSNLWMENYECLQWLNHREPESVLYVNYGSITMMSDEHLVEFAWGLANSKHPFLWVIRPDLVKGDSVNLPRDFLEETRDRAFLTSWCPQDIVLAHPSIRAFLTHCGWNSVMEAQSGGVPLICWPFFAEQQTNCHYICTDWGIGVEVEPDVKRDEIEGLVKEVMGGEKGEEMRRNAKAWKAKAVKATSNGGSSSDDFDKFIKKVLNFDNTTKMCIVRLSEHE